MNYITDGKLVLDGEIKYENIQCFCRAYGKQLVVHQNGEMLLLSKIYNPVKLPRHGIKSTIIQIHLCFMEHISILTDMGVLYLYGYNRVVTYDKNFIVKTCKRQMIDDKGFVYSSTNFGQYEKMKMPALMKDVADANNSGKTLLLDYDDGLWIHSYFDGISKLENIPKIKKLGNGVCIDYEDNVYYLDDSCKNMIKIDGITNVEFADKLDDRMSIITKEGTYTEFIIQDGKQYILDQIENVDLIVNQYPEKKSNTKSARNV